nr:XylR N-terminal domain-containing protein [Caryophanon tenue]
MKANKLVFEHVVDVSPRSGMIKLNNKRMVLAATESLGFLRKDLVQTLGGNALNQF